MKCIFIPLRGGSKSIPNKNIIDVNGHPLCYYIITSALSTGFPVFVSTDSQEIRSVCRAISSEIIIVDRPSAFAQDHSPTEDAINHFLKCYTDVEHIIMLQSTSPLTTTNQICEAYNLFLQKDCNPLLSAVLKHQFFWSFDGTPLNYLPSERPRRQDWPGSYVENGAIYIFTAHHFRNSSCRLTDSQVTIYPMQDSSLLEIDEQCDLALLRKVYF